MPVSSEFVALCRAQITLLTQAFGASISIVYLTQDLDSSGQPRLVAIAAHPESLIEIDSQPNSWLLPAPSTPPPPLNLLAEPQANRFSPGPDAAMLLRPGLPLQEKTEAAPGEPAKAAHALVEQRQIVLPLIYEEGVLGLLVTRRDDRAWEEWEHHQIEAIAQSLALACVMDQRYLWGQREREQERLLQLQQHDLMDNLLHQFRNSLTALQTFSKLILRRLTAGDRSHELAANITHEANRLRDLAQQMEWALDATVTQKSHTLSAATPPLEEEQLGEATLEPHPMPLLPATGALSGQQLPLERCLVETILEPLLASAQAIAREKQITLHSDLAEDLPAIWANPAALREALNNLIENAIKYTPAAGQIWVKAEAPETSSTLEITVSDTGFGIPATDLPRIFERHYRGVQATGEIPGSGLGLAITRSLVEQMHGKIQVFSPALATKQQAPGSPVPLMPGGTTFMVELPLAIGSEGTETHTT